MNTSRLRGRAAIAAVSMAIVIICSACGPQQGVPLDADEEGSRTPAATTEPTVIAPPSGPVTAAEPVATPAVAVASAAAPVPEAPIHAEPAPISEAQPVLALKSFTFPDGHFSFQYPSDWYVKVAEGATLPGGTIDSKIATVSDASGNELFRFHSSDYSGHAAGAGDTTVLDTAPLPGVVSQSGDQVAYGFVVFRGLNWDQDSYFMGLMPGPVMDGRGPSPHGAPMQNGWFSAEVIFGNPSFSSPVAANAWLGTDQGKKLKALLLSVTYQ
jgi:hypothetical protein